MSRESRQDRRKKRRERRNRRREQLDKLIDIIQQAQEFEIQSRPQFLEQFDKIWPMLREMLDFVRAINGRKGETAIQTLIELGNRIESGQASAEETDEFFRQFANIWRNIKIGLNVIAIATRNEKLDAIIDQIIYFGDTISMVDFDDLN